MCQLSYKIAVFSFVYFVNIPEIALSCQFFKFNSGIHEGAVPLCNSKLMTLDTDQDGIPDWKTHTLFGAMIFPNDDDIDGDSVPNVIDPNPLFPFPEDLNSLHEFPSHLLSINNPDIRYLQKKLHRLTGIYTAAYSDEISPKILNALIDIFENALTRFTHEKIMRLRYFFSMKNLSNNALGLYLEPVNAIAVNSNLADQQPQIIYETLAHEIGHSILFSIFDASQLSNLAHDFGGWNIPKATDDLYAPSFLRPYRGINSHHNSFPSSYAYSNSHEWFSENFAHYILLKLGKKNRINKEMTGYFDSLLKL